MITPDDSGYILIVQQQNNNNNNNNNNNKTQESVEDQSDKWTDCDEELSSLQASASKF